MHRRNHTPSLFIIGIVVTALFPGESLAQVETDWKARFFAEAPKRWEEYIRFARCLQITAKSSEHDGADPSLKESARSELKQTELKQAKGSYLSVVHRKIGAENKAEAEGANRWYSFELKRRSPDRGWIITGLELADQSATLSDEQRKRQEEFFQLCVCGCLSLQSQLWLPTLIHDPDFKITAINSQVIEDRLVVRIDFDYPKSEKDYPRLGAAHLKGGWMVLDPEHDWILREYVVHEGHPENWFYHYTFQIREGSDRHPIITHWSYQGVKSGKVVQTIDAQWEVVEQSDVPLEEFTLSAFGLPEPPGIQRERPQWYLWLALGGIACLGIAAMIRWAYRRTGAII